MMINGYTINDGKSIFFNGKEVDHLPLTKEFFEFLIDEIQNLKEEVNFLEDQVYYLSSDLESSNSFIYSLQGIIDDLESELSEYED